MMITEYMYCKHLDKVKAKHMICVEIMLMKL